MHIYLDNRQIAAPAGTFAEGLSAALQAAQSSGRLVMRVVADGTEVEEKWLTNPTSVRGAFCRLECESVPACELVANALREAVGVLGDTRVSQLAAAEHLQLGEPELAFEQLRPVLAGWGAVQQTLTSSASLLQTDVDGMGEAGGVALGKMISDLGAQIAGLKHAISAQDWSSAADTLAYDLDGSCERWGDALKRLSGSVASRTG